MFIFQPPKKKQTPFLIGKSGGVLLAGNDEP